LCPFDRVALVAETAAADSAGGSACGKMPAASELAELDVIADGSSRLLLETQAFYHAPIQGLLVFGGGILFMVIASVLGLGAKGGRAAPSMENSTAVILTLVGALVLGAGLALQHIFRHYTVFDFRSGMLLQQARALGKVLWEGSLMRLDQLIAVGTTTRAAGISAENLKMIIISGLGKGRNQGLPYDVSLAMLSKDGRIHEITAFRNGTRQATLAAGRADMLAGLMNIPCVISKEGEMLEVARKPGRPMSLQAVSISAVAKRSENVANKVLMWLILLVFLIGGWFILMAWSGVWK